MSISSYSQQRIFFRDIIKESKYILEEYLNAINTLEIFDCQYFNWGDILSREISINYPKFNNQCYPSAHIKRLIEKLHYVYGNPNLVK